MRLTAFLPSLLPSRLSSHLPSRLPRRASAQLPALALLLVAVLLLVALLPRPAAASDMPSYDLTLDNGRLTPEVLEVKAGEKFVIQLHNAGNTPAEFESNSLRKEKVLAPGVKSFVVIHPLRAGSYDFFDDFHLPDARGKVVAE
ncbi:MULTISPECIES: cupredoxin domain-containing protein [unclassified Cobetia]|uniref:cupredoxin domain-containing protein n=1 Tax=unclassified Cobetia TaxID=2609414 RepID=UPI0020974E60|nr:MULTISPECIES: cupredoxin domain-containing protein [unclassified Cobetia]MCO7232411.1 cupredoxin domain-containing protein [Cobetia sp. Dlab-2-AX]MCO7235685.1 cupredoxin domain-containing protein [Cobetia sp. Dlab-2-U]